MDKIIRQSTSTKTSARLQLVNGGGAVYLQIK